VTDQQDLCCFRDCAAPVVALGRWGPICHEHSSRHGEGAQFWYDEAQRFRRELEEVQNELRVTRVALEQLALARVGI
jgi:hypothetical protein